MPLQKDWHFRIKLKEENKKEVGLQPLFGRDIVIWCEEYLEKTNMFAFLKSIHYFLPQTIEVAVCFRSPQELRSHIVFYEKLRMFEDKPKAIDIMNTGTTTTKNQSASFSIIQK